MVYMEIKKRRTLPQCLLLIYNEVSPQFKLPRIKDIKRILKQHYCCVVFHLNYYICGMNFKDLNKDIAKEFGLTQAQSKDILTFIEKTMRKKLLYGTNISIRGIGSLLLKVREPRKYLHIPTQELKMSRRVYSLVFKIRRKFNQELKQKTVY